MQPDAPLFAGWHSTDAEEPVTVRQSDSPAPAPQSGVDIRGPLADIRHVPIERYSGTVAPNPRAMRLAAFTGIAVVLAGAAFYFGIDSLRGTLTDSGSTGATVTITAGGQFTPAAVNVRPGYSVTIANANKDPQVLKSKDGRDLFPVQVIFTTPYTFTVPSNAQGTYVYFSETLPDDRTLTFTVETATAASSSSASAEASPSVSVTVPSDSGGGTVSIPLPFGAPVQESSPGSAPSAIVVQQSDETALISLKEQASASSSSSTSFETNNVPTNPYTVGTKAERPETTDIAENAKQTQQLRSGAPIRQLQKYAPRKVPETGPAGMALVFLPALIAVVFVFRRMNDELRIKN